MMKTGGRILYVETYQVLKYTFSSTGANSKCNLGASLRNPLPPERSRIVPEYNYFNMGRRKN